MDTRREDNRGLVFGLDIGTRNVVGTVGYRDENETFNVIAQYCVEHGTRAMLDGQIHDIAKVGRTIQEVKEKLEEMIEQPLTDVCIAAAGRVAPFWDAGYRRVFPPPAPYPPHPTAPPSDW